MTHVPYFENMERRACSMLEHVNCATCMLCTAPTLEGMLGGISCSSAVLSNRHRSAAAHLAASFEDSAKRCRGRFTPAKWCCCSHAPEGTLLAVRSLSARFFGKEDKQRWLLLMYSMHMLHYSGDGSCIH
jgi:hypothetical protein